jgi:hypothetical protein
MREIGQDDVPDGGREVIHKFFFMNKILELQHRLPPSSSRLLLFTIGQERGDIKKRPEMTLVENGKETRGFEST